MPEKDTQDTVHIRPGETLVLSGVKFGELSIDILGPDIIMSDLVNNSKVILPGLGLILFSEDEAPGIVVGQEVITPEALLAKIGIISNITQKDFLSFTSLEINPGQGQDETKESLPGEQQEYSEVDIVAALQQMQVQKDSQTEDVDQETTDEIESIIDGSSVSNSQGVPNTVSVKDNSSSLINSSTPVEEVDPNDGGVRSFFDFGVKLLQLQSFNDSGANTYEGGGGAQLSAFNPSNTQQFSTDQIDVISNSSIRTVYSDDPDYFDETSAARVAQVSPNLPSGFEVTQVDITLMSGAFPAGFDIKGIIDDTGDNNITVAAAPDGSGGFVIADANGLALNSLGNLDIVFTYDVGVAEPVFQVSFNITATFDTASGFATPDQTTQTFEFLQKFAVQDVNSTADLALTDGGDTVFVLSTVPNANEIKTSDSDVEVYGGRGVDAITSGAGDDVIYGTLGNDTIDGGGNGADTGINALGDVGDTLDYSAKNVAINVDMSTGATFSVDIDAGTYTDSVTNIENITGSSVDDTISGNTGNNILRGGAGDDVLSGNDGDDTLDGGTDVSVGDTVSYAYVVGGTGITVDLDGTGSATVSAPAGDTDTLIDIENIVGTGFDDTFLGSPENNSFDGGAGTDTISYAEAGVSGIVVDIGANGLGDGTASNDGGGGGGVDSLLSIENVIGSLGNDTITGDAGNNLIMGGLGSDTLDGAGSGDTDTLSFADLSGGFVTLDLDASTAVFSGDASTDNFSNFEDYVLTAQDDVLLNSAGNDIVDAGAGTADTVNFSLSSAVSVDLQAGTATDNGGGAGIAIGNDTLTNFENVVGSNLDDIITGSTANNSLSGGGGDDTLSGGGGGGNDTLDGGAGNNTVSYASAAGSVLADLSTLSATNDGDGGSDTFVNIQNLTGSSYIDVLNGDGAVNIIIGGAGNDFIDGKGGDDDLQGGNNNDTITGGAGIDTIDGGSGTDTASYTGAAGGITVDFSDPAPNIQVTNDGDSASDTLISIETISASGNADTFIMDNVAITIDGNGNTDFVDYSGMTGSNLTVRLDNVSFQIFGGSGSTQRITEVENVTTADGDDTIYGSSSANVINAGTGDNYVYGSAGIDTIVFGAGNDTLDYSTASTAITSVTLDVNGDGLIDRGSADDTVTGVENIIGTTSGDTLTGNSGVNYLGGYNGNDTLAGGTGNDFLDGGNGTDTINYVSRTDATGGISFDLSVIDAALDPFGNGSYKAVTLNGAGEIDYIKNVEIIRGTNDDDTMTGNSSANQFYGNDGVDTINGGDGNDTIYGGNGDDIIDGGNNNDTIYGEAGADTINGGAGTDVIIGGAGIDTIDGGTGTDTINYSSAAAGINVNLGTGTVSDDGDGASDVIVGSSIENVTGSGDDDIIIGSSGVNVINGGVGDDTLTGGAGNDTINGGTGTADIIDFSAEGGGAGITVNLGAGSATDTYGNTDTLSNIEDVIGTGSDDVITGSSANNNLKGGGGADTFYASGGNDTLKGQTGGSDTVDYTTFGGSVSGGLIGSSSGGTLVKSSGGTDNITGIEFFKLSNNADTISVTTDALSTLALNSIDGNGGTDVMTISEFGNNLTDLDVDGDTMANVFADVEEIDLTGATVTGPDEFDLTEADVLGIAGAGGTLTLTVSSGFSLNLDDTGDGSGNLFTGVSQTFALTNGTTVDVQVV